MKTKKVEFKRVLIHENLDKLEKIIGQLPQYRPHLEDLKEKYNVLQIGNFTDEVFKELLSDGIGKVEKRYIEYLNKEMDKMGVSSNLIRDNMTKESSMQLETLKASLNNLKSFRPRATMIAEHIPNLTIELITFGRKPEAFYISDDDSEVLLERYCRTYIEDQREKDGYDALCRLVNAYGDFLDATNGIRVHNFTGLSAIKMVIMDTAELPKDHPERNNRPTMRPQDLGLLFLPDNYR